MGWKTVVPPRTRIEFWEDSTARTKEKSVGKLEKPIGRRQDIGIKVPMQGLSQI